MTHTNTVSSIAVSGRSYAAAVRGISAKQIAVESTMPIPAAPEVPAADEWTMLDNKVTQFTLHTASTSHTPAVSSCNQDAELSLSTQSFDLISELDSPRSYCSDASSTVSESCDDDDAECQDDVVPAEDDCIEEEHEEEEAEEEEEDMHDDDFSDSVSHHLESSDRSLYSAIRGSSRGYLRSEQRQAVGRGRVSYAVSRTITANKDVLHAMAGSPPNARPKTPYRSSVSSTIPSPYEAIERREMQYAQMVAMREWQQSLSQPTPPSPIPSTPIVAPAIKKQVLRTQQLQQRNTKLHTRRVAMSGSKWTDVVQQREATKACVAERLSLCAGRNGSNKRAAPSRNYVNSVVSSIRSVKAAANKGTFSARYDLTRGLRWVAERRAEKLAPLKKVASPPEAVEEQETAPADTEHLSPSNTSFDSFRRHWYYHNREKIETSLDPERGNRVTAVRLAKIDSSVSDAFLEKRKDLAERNPKLTFHGTSPANHASILKYGLLIPGKSHAHGFNITVVNGSSCGRGIYSSETAGFALGYNRCATRTMFVCAVLTKESGEVIGKVKKPTPLSRTRKPLRHGTPQRAVVYSYPQVVVFDESRIVPLFFLDFEPCVQLAGSHGGHFLTKARQRVEVRNSKEYTRPSKFMGKRLIRAAIKKFSAKYIRVARVMKQI